MIYSSSSLTRRTLLQTHYETLGVSPDANDEVIKNAYRKLAMRFHPDRNQSSPVAVTAFQQVTEAYKVLSSPEERAQYDQVAAYPTTVMALRQFPGTATNLARWMPHTKAAAHPGNDRLVIAHVPKGTLSNTVTCTISFKDSAGMTQTLQVTPMGHAPIIIPGQGLPGANGGDPGNLMVVLIEKD